MIFLEKSVHFFKIAWPLLGSVYVLTLPNEYEKQSSPFHRAYQPRIVVQADRAYTLRCYIACRTLTAGRKQFEFFVFQACAEISKKSLTARPALASPPNVLFAFDVVLDIVILFFVVTCIRFRTLCVER